MKYGISLYAVILVMIIIFVELETVPAPRPSVYPTV